MRIHDLRSAGACLVLVASLAHTASAADILIADENRSRRV